MPAELVSKRMRQDMILEIVKNNEVHNQLELIKHLEARGISATQSSVSRDIHELSIAKVDGRYMVAVLPVHGTRSSEAADASSSSTLVTALSPAGPSVLVVKTIAGSAPSVGLSIDKARWPEVLGTIAGDDTIFVATPGKREQLRLIARLQEFMRQSPETELIHSPHERPEVAPDPVHEPEPEPSGSAF